MATANRRLGLTFSERKAKLARHGVLVSDYRITVPKPVGLGVLGLVDLVAEELGLPVEFRTVPAPRIPAWRAVYRRRSN